MFKVAFQRRINMLGKFKVITLCGNHELIDEFFKQQNKPIIYLE